jgi:N-acetyl-alpha-D-glucosaminyl L-malate synthase BshA
VAAQIPAKLLMIGDGPERTHIEMLSREMACADKITFLGKQEAVEEILSVCDLFILPSETESFGLAALEAMACEVPVISSNAGGIPEVNIHGETGYLSKVGDVADMAKNAMSILQDDTTLKRFKANALNRAKHFNLENIMEQYIAVYRRCLSAIQSGV